MWVAIGDTGYRVTFTAPRNAEASPQWHEAIARMVERARPARVAWRYDVWDDASAQGE